MFKQERMWRALNCSTASWASGKTGSCYFSYRLEYNVTEISRIIWYLYTDLTSDSKYIRSLSSKQRANQIIDVLYQRKTSYGFGQIVPLGELGNWEIRMSVDMKSCLVGELFR